jgi:hypothetical protein
MDYDLHGVGGTVRSGGERPSVWLGVSGLPVRRHERLFPVGVRIRHRHDGATMATVQYQQRGEHDER